MAISAATKPYRTDLLGTDEGFWSVPPDSSTVKQQRRVNGTVM